MISWGDVMDLSRDEMESLATRLEQQAKENRERAQESFDRCDTDGFLSQWASNISADLRDLQKELLRKGCRERFAGVTTLEGVLLQARRVQTQFGTKWVVDHPKHGAVWFDMYAARESTFTKKGLRPIWYEAPAWAVISDGNGGRSRGLSGAANCRPITIEREGPKTILGPRETR